jgi:hypothetical protein
MTDWFLSHTQLTPSHTQPPTSPQSSSPIYVRVLVRVVGAVGTVEKDFFVCFRMILATEHLIVLVHDIFDRGSVRELVDHYLYHVCDSVKESGSRLTSSSCPAREKTCSTLDSAAR